jgi:hypothetical protein
MLFELDIFAVFSGKCAAHMAVDSICQNTFVCPSKEAGQWAPNRQKDVFFGK